ncbi:MAG: hypothetical protein RML40_07115 [Bacteroidota bacterium]|nr:hypothetical protein [Candidatus Kapabacteria bacterium]MDW8220286.1 hypothetical protein [Bacteroidota bacterium]
MLLWHGVVRIHAQHLESKADIYLTNITVMLPRTIEFDIVLVNRSAQSTGSWYYWANGTFRLKLDSTTSLYDANIVLDSSDLHVLHHNVQQRTGYEMKTLIHGQTIILGILGPDSLEHAHVCLPDVPVLLGRCRVVMKDTIRNPQAITLAWVLPIERQQANAFKSEQTTVREGQFYQRSNNYEMHTRYSADAPSIEQLPRLVCSTRVQAEYRGDKRVLLRWRTQEERISRRTNAGFIILRQYFPQEYADSTTARSTHFDTVATFMQVPTLKLRGAAYGAEYSVLDSVPRRGMVYVYRVIFYDATKLRVQEFETVLSDDTVHVVAPNAVLAHVHVYPNPFGEHAIVEYELLDRALVAVRCIDAVGREIMVVEDGERLRGTHRVPIQAQQLGHQALVLLVVTAVPVNDEAVEHSQAVVKVQMRR